MYTIVYKQHEKRVFHNKSEARNVFKNVAASMFDDTAMLCPMNVLLQLVTP